MTTGSRFDRQLPAILEDLYLWPSPDYRDEVLATATRSRQRPAWTFPGRWLPVTDIAVRPVPAPRLPMRAVGVAILLLALLVAALVIVGSRTRVVPPFGPAGNGLITWAMDGDIYVGDAATGTSRRIVATDDIDRNPVFSRDGSHLAFLRQVPIQTGHFDLVVTNADGSAARVLNAVSISIPEAVEWAPDGESLLVNDSNGRLARYFVDRSAAQPMLEGVRLEPEAFRPPDGSQILYERDDDPGALHVMNVDGSGAKTLFAPRTAPCACNLAGPARWSPDGRHVAFAVNADGVQSRMYVMAADGSGLRQLAQEGGVWIENDPAWSPDGTRLAFNRWERYDAENWSVRPMAIVDIDTGAFTPIGISPAAEGAIIEWSPDGADILALPGTLSEAFTWSPGANGTVARPTLINLADRGSNELDWSVGSIASWQRLAP